MSKLSVEAAIQHLRSDAAYSALIENSYLEDDPGRAAVRFSESAEFEETWDLVNGRVPPGPLLDLGAGRGIAAFAFAQRVASVVAAEPDLSDDIGAGAARSVLGESSASVLAARCPILPFPDGTFATVYTRQVLHHLSALPEALADIARVLQPGGLYIAAREHVVDDAAQLEAFLDAHPVHQLAGGEGAFSLGEFTGAITGAGLELEAILRPWDSVINAFPQVRSVGELQEVPARLLRQRMGPLGGWLGRFRLVQRLVFRRLNRSRPGRVFSFVARKPIVEQPASGVMTGDQGE